MAHYLPTRSRHKESPTQKKNVLGQFKYDKNINNCNNNKINKLIKDELSFHCSSIIAYFWRRLQATETETLVSTTSISWRHVKLNQSSPMAAKLVLMKLTSSSPICSAHTILPPSLCKTQDVLKADITLSYNPCTIAFY